MLLDLLKSHIARVNPSEVHGEIFVVQNPSCHVKAMKSCEGHAKIQRALPGFEPGTTRTQAEYHTPRPMSLSVTLGVDHNHVVLQYSNTY